MSKDTIDTINTANGVSSGERVFRASETNTQPKTQKPAYAPQRSTVPRPPQQPDDEEDDSFLQRYRGALIAGTIVLIGGVWFAFSKPSGDTVPAKKAPEKTVVKISLPPPASPPPPPPPPVQPPPKQEVDRIAPTEKPAEKPVEAAKAKLEDLGTSIKGSGKGTAGLGDGRGNGIIGGTGTGPGGGGGTISGWYAGQLRTKVAEAMKKHPKTRTASIENLKVSVTLDPTGKIASARLVGTTGDRAVDDAIRNEILPNITFNDPPRTEKPMTFTLLLSAKRPK